MTSTTTVADQICQFFGGTYDSALHFYHPPTVAGLSTVRRAWPKQDDGSEYFYGQPLGTATGTVMVVWISGGHDHRVALPAIQGRRKTHYSVDLNCYILSTAAFAEDCQEFGYALRDALFTKIRTDPTLGTGGIENGAFQVGEGSEDGGGEIAWTYEQGETVDEVTKAYLQVSFEAHAYEVA